MQLHWQTGQSKGCEGALPWVRPHQLLQRLPLAPRMGLTWSYWANVHCGCPPTHPISAGMLACWYYHPITGYNWDKTHLLHSCSNVNPTVDPFFLLPMVKDQDRPRIIPPTLPDQSLAPYDIGSNQWNPTEQRCNHWLEQSSTGQPPIIPPRRARWASQCTELALGLGAPLISRGQYKSFYMGCRSAEYIVRLCYITGKYCRRKNTRHRFQNSCVDCHIRPRRLLCGSIIYNRSCHCHWLSYLSDLSYMSSLSLLLVVIFDQDDLSTFCAGKRCAHVHLVQHDRAWLGSGPWDTKLEEGLDGSSGDRTQKSHRRQSSNALNFSDQSIG